MHGLAGQFREPIRPDRSNRISDLIPASLVSYDVETYFESHSRGTGLNRLETEEATRHQVEEFTERSFRRAAPKREAG